MHCIILASQAGNLIVCFTGVRRTIMKTYRWHREKSNGKFVTVASTNNIAGDKSENAASGVAYKKIIHGWGEGEAALGKTLELIPTLNSYLFVSLIK